MIWITPLLLRYLAGRYVNAMAIWPIILVRNIETKESIVTINHEKIHIRQQVELLVLPFYILYLFYYLKYRILGHSHIQSYYLIPFEKEAYHHESDLEYLSNRKWLAWLAFR